MNGVTVVITTTGRPDFLRVALQSVLNQVDRGLVSEVLVSENKGDSRSLEVAREFTDLPIRYVQREPTLPLVAHAFMALREVQTPYVAVLNDDDWWSSGHVAESLAALEDSPSASASLSACVFVRDESDNSPFWIYRSPALWLVSGKPSWMKRWTIDALGMLALGWVYTPFHVSTMVCRTAALKSVMDALGDPVFYAHTIDRLLFAQLALWGPLTYNPISDTFIRSHSGNWAKDKDQNEIRGVLRSTAELIGGWASARGWSVRDAWAELLADMPRDDELSVLQRFQETYTLDELRHHDLAQYFQRHLDSWYATILRRKLTRLRSMAFR